MDLNSESTKEQAEAALLQTCAMLDDLKLDYVIYIRTAHGTYGRRIKYKSAKEMVDGCWFISIDIGDCVHQIAKVAAEEVDDKLGGVG